jgi:hypothetical protein
MVGWDTEYVHQGGDNNRIVSYQFCALGVDSAWSGLHIPRGSSRLSLAKSIEAVIRIGLHSNLLKKCPKRVTLCTHFATADLPGFRNASELFRDVDSVRKTFVSLSDPISIKCYDRTRHAHELQVTLRDSMLLAPSKMQSLAVLGDIIGLPKITLSDGDISHMDEYLSRDFAGFEKYAIRDAEISVLYCDKIRQLNRDVSGRDRVPVTMTSIGINQLFSTWDKCAIDADSVLGREVVRQTRFNGKFSRSVKTTVSLPSVHRHEAFAVETYHGARNETYLFGAAEEGQWTDQDLCGAYTTAMASIGMPLWKELRLSSDVADFQPGELGFAQVEFSFPLNTRFPCLPVRTEAGLLFPLRGESYCCSPEIYLAQRMGADLRILDGIIIPQNKAQRPFAAFIRETTRRRKTYIKGTLEELFWKEMGNAVYGKTAQGLRPKRCYSSRDDQYDQLPPSKITNPYLAAYVTSFVRATLGEILHALPSRVAVCNATTDGFLSTASAKELAMCTDGAVCRLFRNARIEIVGKDEILEEKHRVTQPLAWRTRGQATLKAGADGKLVLAKAGIKPPMTKVEEQNEWIITTFRDRGVETRQNVVCLRSLADICREGGDLVPKTINRRIRMDYDWKREPRIAGERHVRGVPLLSFDTKPWVTSDEALRCREDWQAFTKSNSRVLKTLQDMEDFLAYRRTGAGPVPKRRPRTEHGAKQLAVRQFLRAYNGSFAGIDADSSYFNYRELADWLTKKGFPCKKSDVENAGRRTTKFEPQTVPRTSDVIALFAEVTEIFPAFNADLLLEPVLSSRSAEDFSPRTNIHLSDPTRLS